MTARPFALSNQLIDRAILMPRQSLRSIAVAVLQLRAQLVTLLISRLYPHIGNFVVDVVYIAFISYLESVC